MTDQSNVFEEIKEKKDEGGAADPSTPTPSSGSSDSVFADQLAAIRNERGEQKYDSLQKALEALQHSQALIPEQKNQIADLQETVNKLKSELEKRASVEDIVSKLTPSQASTETPEQGLDEEKVSALFEQLLDRRTSAQKEADNKTAVNTALIEKFGSVEAAQAAVKEKAASLGTTVGELQSLSAKSPQMVLAYFDTVSKPQSSGSPPSSSVSSDGFLSQKPKEEGLKRPEKSLLAGATYKDQLAYLQEIRKDVYKKYGIDQ